MADLDIVLEIGSKNWQLIVALWIKTINQAEKILEQLPLGKFIERHDMGQSLGFEPRWIPAGHSQHAG